MGRNGEPFCVKMRDEFGVVAEMKYLCRRKGFFLNEDLNFMVLALVLVMHCWACWVVQQVGCSLGMPRMEVVCGEDSVKKNETMEEYRYHYKYPHPSVTTDCVIFGFDGAKLNVLLIERRFDPYKGCWAFPGGFLEMEESADEGARRELMEETGLETAFIKQFHAFSKPDRDPRERVITIAYYALVRMSEVKGMDDAAQAKWFPVDAVPQLAFDHDEMFFRAKEALKNEFRLGGKDLDALTAGFTQAECRQIEEGVKD